MEKVWRTGANAATRLSIDGPMTMGGTQLTAGEYSLWTVPHEHGSFDLIINSQPNVWGTNHDPAFDLHAIPMEFARTENATEQFTISVEDEQLTLAWGDWKASVEVK